MNRFEKLRHHISEIEGKILPAKELSRLLGVSPTVIGSIERGDISPSPKVAARLSQRYGISKEWFLTGDGVAPWEEGRQDDWWDAFEEIKQAVKEGKEKPGADKMHGGFGAIYEILHSSHPKLLDYFIEAGRNPAYREYIYNVIEGGSSKLLDQIDQFRARIKELEKALEKKRSVSELKPIPFRRAPAPEPAALRKTASHEPTFESVEVNLKISDPPPDLLPEDKERWLKNAGTLRRWQKTNRSFYVPSWALERFCRELVHFYDGGDLSSVGGILKDFVDEGRVE